jgi:hypothetical protein
MSDDRAMTPEVVAVPVERCNEPGCDEDAIPCFLPSDTDTPSEWYCPTHAALNGYCKLCGTFCGGMESFEFIHPDYCDNCWDEIEAEDAEPDEDDEYYYDRLEDVL